MFAKLGAGFDIVSGGELARVLAAGGDPQKIVFSGVGKTADEMRAALNAGIFCFNVESASALVASVAPSPLYISRIVWHGNGCQYANNGHHNHYLD